MLKNLTLIDILNDMSDRTSARYALSHAAAVKQTVPLRPCLHKPQALKICSIHMQVPLRLHLRRPQALKIAHAISRNNLKAYVKYGCQSAANNQMES